MDLLEPTGWIQNSLRETNIDSLWLLISHAPDSVAALKLCQIPNKADYIFHIALSIHDSSTREQLKISNKNIKLKILMTYPSFWESAVWLSRYLVGVLYNLWPKSKLGILPLRLKTLNVCLQRGTWKPLSLQCSSQLILRKINTWVVILFLGLLVFMRSSHGKYLMAPQRRNIVTNWRIWTDVDILHPSIIQLGSEAAK